MDSEGNFKCPFCGEEFDTENEEGAHRAKEHVNDKPIGGSPNNDSDSSIINSWKSEGKKK